MSDLPDEWLEVKLENFVKFVIGGDWGKDLDYEDKNFVEAYCIRGAEFRNWQKEKGATASLRKIKKSSLLTRKLQHNDILVEISGGSPEQPVGRTVLIEPAVFNNIGNENVVGTNFLRLLRSVDEINSKYLNYYLQFFYSSKNISDYQSGSNNLRNLRFNDYLTIEIPFTAYQEQERIAELLDSYLAQVETIKAQLSAIPDILKKFRQSVLADAVSGRLIEFGSHKTVLLQNITIINPKKEKLDDSLSVSFSPMNLMPINYGEDLKFEEKLWQDVKKGFTFFQNEDVLLAKITPCFENGKSVIARNLINNYGTGSTEYHVIRCNPQVLPEWILFHFKMESFIKNGVMNMQGAVGHRRVPKDFLENLEVILPPIEEQQQIVERVEKLFIYADDIEIQTTQALAHINNLTQSILAKAFSGQLTADWRTQNPDLITGDNSATALLAKIQTQKENDKPAKKITKTKKG